MSRPVLRAPASVVGVAALMRLCLEDHDGRKLYLDDAQREGCVSLTAAPFPLSALFEPIEVGR